MAYVGESENIMRPKKGDTTINLPITFDYSGGRKESNRSKYLWVGIIAVISLIVGVGIMTSDGGFFLFNILLGVGFLYGMLLFIRFVILKEHKIRNRMAEMLEDDYKRDYTDIWGIPSMDDTYPYYAHLRNGKSAIYIMFEKDVVLGKVADAQYEHYEAIGDAYNIAGANKIGICYIDYMDNIGTDERLTECFKSLSSVDNEDIRDILTDVYSNLQEMMNRNVSTFDVYAFTFKHSESTFWYDIQEVINCMLDANYVSFKILNSNDLRDITKSLFNLHDFSVNEASSQAFGLSDYKGIIPVSVVSSDGVETIINKTMEEKEELRKLKEKEEILRKEEKKRRKKNKNKKSSNEEEIDLFE